MRHRQRLSSCLLALAAFFPAAMAETVASVSSNPPVAAAPAAAPWVQAYAYYGEPKYGPGFDHFDYVNPDAPKGGTLNLKNPDRRTSFDKFNPFTTRGNSPAGLVIYVFETLAILSGDEPNTMYGLLAEEMRIAPDKSSITFRLHPKARFSNGDPVLAKDVKYSFDSMAGKYASPTYQSAFEGVTAKVLDARTIRFDLARPSKEMLFTIGTNLYVFSRKWGLKPDGTHKRFDEIVDEQPIGSGPYTIGAVDMGRRIEFVRDPNYWARDLPVRRGFFNFDRVVYRYYRDDTVATEAFKAGEYDIVRVYGARTWNRQHKGPKWDSGQIVKENFETGFGQYLQAYDFNLRRPIFQDRRVREAIILTYDFDTWNNRYKMYTRASSMFNNSEFAAQGLPSEAELKLLEPFRSELPPEVFGPAYVAPGTNGEASKLRANLLKARALLEAAGWKLAPDGKLRNAKGEAFEFEYMTPQEGSTATDWQQNLAKLGITMKVRQVDFALYSRRLENYDYDMVAIVEGRFTLPDANQLETLYGSKAADEKGNHNFRGVKSPAVDALIKAMQNAKTKDELITASRALDRVVMWSAWQVPDLYFSKLPTSYWNKFGRPEVEPKYYSIDSALDLQPAWPITTWWIRDPAKR
jgi:peptide/nickel transport system substrate-binding protein/microcin C transport system substrate-binding protein